MSSQRSRTAKADGKKKVKLQKNQLATLNVTRKIGAVQRAPRPFRLVEKANGDVPQLATRSRLSPYYSQLVKQMVTPGNCDSVVTSPNETPVQVFTRKLHSCIDVSHATHGASVKIAMLPDLFMPGYVSSQGAGTVPAAGPGAVTVAGQQKFLANGHAAEGKVMAKSSASGVDESALVKVVNLADAAGSVKPCIEMTATLGTPQVTALLENVTNTDVTPSIQFFGQVVAGNWTSLSAIQPLVRAASGSGGSVTMAFGLPLGCIKLGWSFVNQSNKELTLNMTLGFSAQIITGAGTSYGPAFQSFILDNNITSGRVVSMAMLVQCTSSEMYNGGDINIGRVPVNFNPYGDIAAQMAPLPPNRMYQGAAKHGGYAFWVPAQFDEWCVDNVAQIRQNLLGAEWLLANLENIQEHATFRVHFWWVVEAYTPNQVFEKSLTPMMDATFRRIYYQVLATNAASCNPAHDSLFSKVISGIKSGAGGLASVYRAGSKAYDDHRAAIDMIAHALSALALV